MNKNPLISVVIPTYNRSSYIAEALESVFRQKGHWDIEVIVVDDGSTDNTKAVIEPYRDKVRYFEIPHSGLPAVARNFGISKAKGELIAFQDSDDAWVDDKLYSQMPLFDNPQVVMSYGDAVVMDSEGKRSNKRVVGSMKLTGGEKFETLLKDNVISTLTTVLRKSALDEVGGFNESSGLKAVEDYNLWLRIAANYPKGVKSVDRTLAYYRVHDDNISSAGALEAVERLLVVYRGLWKEPGLNAAQRNSLEETAQAMEENWSRLMNELEDKPAISVVMGIYKDEKFVKKAIQSILDQTYKNFEFIIIDDGCQDKSVEITKSFKDKRIRLIHQTNHGLVYTLNKGVKLARAELIARMDADDISMPSRFKEELALFKDNDKLGVVGGFFSYIDEDSKLTGTTMTSTTKHIDIVRHMYFDNPIGHGTTLLRKQAISEAGGYRDTYGPNEDYDLWRRIAQQWRISQVPKVLYRYRLNPAGISSTKSELQHKFFAELVEDIWKGPVYKKSVWAIVKDARFYKKLDSPFADQVFNQYKSHQVRLSFEFLVHGKLWTGYMNSLAALIIYPLGAIRLWNTWLWAPVKLMLGKAK